MKKVIIIGGGLAGLSAAVHLTKNKFKVTLLEASPKIGGRVYSFIDDDTSTEIDNGQHILMGCYSDTLTFLKMIDAFRYIKIQESLEINYLSENKNTFRLKVTDSLYPLNLLFGLLDFKQLNIREKLSLLKLFLKIRSQDSQKLYGLNVNQWLKQENQSEKSIRVFWEIISIGALNTSTDKSSAKIFSDILKEIFWKDKTAYKIILPSLPLSKTFCEPAISFIERNGGEILLSERCTAIEVNDGRVIKVKTDKNVYEDFDFVISAIPYYALEKIIDNNFLNKQPEFNYSSILNVHIWIKENFLQQDFYAFYNSELHWLFNKGTHWNIVISNADKFMQMSKEEIYTLIITKLKNFISIKDEDIRSYKVIKEKRATFIPDEITLKNRPSTETKVKNLFIVGDWVDTKLPATIESAVRSGRIAAEKIIFQNE